jgi:hypothetical protein
LRGIAAAVRAGWSAALTGHTGFVRGTRLAASAAVLRTQLQVGALVVARHLSRRAHARAGLTELPGRTHRVAHTAMLRRDLGVDAGATAEQCLLGTLAEAVATDLAVHARRRTDLTERETLPLLAFLSRRRARTTARTAVRIVGRSIDATGRATRERARTAALSIRARPRSAAHSARAAVLRIAAEVQARRAAAPLADATRRRRSRRPAGRTDGRWIYRAIRDGAIIRARRREESRPQPDREERAPGRPITVREHHFQLATQCGN